MHTSSILSVLVLCAPLPAAQTLIHAEFGAAPGDRLGNAVALLGDLDGDGRAEWMVERGGPDGHRPELFVHSSRGGALLYDLSGGGDIGPFFLPALGDVGDVDGDGVHDFAFGNSSARIDNQTHVGRLVVYSGRLGQALYITPGVLPGGAFGASVSALGDIDGDGVSDLVVGQIGSQDEHVWTVSGASGTRLFSVQGPRGGDPEFGWAVAACGDLDGDGTPDFAAGTLRKGEVRYFSGAGGRRLLTLKGEHSFGRALIDLGDLDGDGLRELGIGESGRHVVWIVSGRSAARFPVSIPEGIDALAAAGDVDGDGLTDFLVGDGSAGNDTGAVWILSSRRRTVLAKLVGAHLGDRFGASVAGGADVDGDGRPDFVIGAPGADASARGGDQGEVRVYSSAPLAPR